MCRNICILLSVLFFCGNIRINAQVATVPFITTWKTDNPGFSNDDQVRLPMDCNTCTIDWGDGLVTTEMMGPTHTYNTPGTYTISITGTFSIFRMGAGNNDSEKLITIDQWGDAQWSTMERAFSRCVNVQGDFTDAPDLSNVTSMARMFDDAESFNYPINDWDVSNVTDMSGLFARAITFDQDLNMWDVSNVTNMNGTFNNSRAFNSDISTWDVGSVSTMNSMFLFASNFNVDISAWDVSNGRFMDAMLTATPFNQDISRWQTQRVQTMRNMFGGCTAFNQDISAWVVDSVTNMGTMFQNATAFNADISGWNVSRVTNMNSMFASANSFNQDISSWAVDSVTRMDRMFSRAGSFDQNLGDWNVSNVTSIDRMFEGITLSTSNYDSILIGWNAQDLQPNLEFSGGNSLYCEGEMARQNMINSDGWIITDGGLANVQIDAITDQIAAGIFTFPAITGIDLSNEVRYYTESMGMGISYEVGDQVRFTDFSSYPVTIYIYDEMGPGCTDETSFELTITDAVVLDCPTITLPLSNAIDVPINTDFEWDPLVGVDGYIVSIRTRNFSQIFASNVDVGNMTTFSLSNNLPVNTLVGIQVNPYNLNDTLECNTQLFNTVNVIPECTNLNNPLNGALNVPVNTNLSWNIIPNITGYRLSVGTFSGGTDIINNLDVGEVTTFNLPNELPLNTQVFVTVTPFNEVGDAMGCVEESFITEEERSISTVPECTALNSPLDGSLGVPVNVNLSWDIVSDITGYRLSIGTFSGGVDVINNLDVGGVTTFSLPNELPLNTQVFVTIIPFNEVGDAVGCLEESFSTEEQEVIPIPSCSPAISFTLNGGQAIVNWEEVSSVDGYLVSISTPEGNIILDEDIRDVTSTRFSIESVDTVFIAMITPFNTSGSALNCPAQLFEINREEIQVPNIFTPNGDQQNDDFVIIGLDTQPNARVSIFNRYGQEIFSTTSYADNPWQGDFNGSEIQEGVYYYIIQVNGEEDITGVINLIR